MQQYHKHLHRVMRYGTPKPPSRDGQPGTISLFGYQNHYNLTETFPLLTTKEIDFKQIVVELLWFLQGSTNIEFLVKNKVNIWNEDAYHYYCKLWKNQGMDERLKMSYKEFVTAIKQKAKEEDFDARSTYLPLCYDLGDCGHQYGKVWRKWEGVINEAGRFEKKFELPAIASTDQLRSLVEGLIKSPHSRRHIITAIDPINKNNLALYWCHCMVQFNCRQLSREQKKDYPNKKFFLDCHLYQRSADMFLGVPYNIASYALFTNILAAMTNMVPGTMIHSFGDSHIYENHFEQVAEILERDPEMYPLPVLYGDLLFRKEVDSFRKEELSLNEFIRTLDANTFRLPNYQSYPAIKAPLNTGLNEEKNSKEE